MKSSATVDVKSTLFDRSPRKRIALSKLQACQLNNCRPCLRHMLTNPYIDSNQYGARFRSLSYCSIYTSVPFIHSCAVYLPVSYLCPQDVALFSSLRLLSIQGSVLVYVLFHNGLLAPSCSHCVQSCGTKIFTLVHLLAVINIDMSEIVPRILLNF